MGKTKHDDKEIKQKKDKYANVDLDKLTDEDLKFIGLHNAEIRLFRAILDMPAGIWIRSVELTAKLGITQATISESMRIFKEFGWIESSARGYRRVMKPTA